MKIFITGINSFIGSNLASYLSVENHQIYGSVSNENKLADKKEVIKGTYLIKLDKPFDEKIINRMDVIIHCAHDSSRNSLEKNVNGTIAISAAARNKNNKQIFISSYSAHKYNSTDYGKVKSTLEKYFVNEGHVVIRPGLVVGSGGLFLRIYKIMKKFPVLPLLDGGNGLIPILCIKDLEVSVGKIINKYNNGIFNLFNDKYITLYKFIYEIRNYANLNIFFISIPSKIIIRFILLINKCGIKLPINYDNIKSFTQNQQLTLKSDLHYFVKNERKFSEMIRQISINNGKY